MNFLVNLENSSYLRYLKDNNEIIYVNTESTHSLSIIKQLPKSIELRLSQLSANEEIFKSSIKPYKEALMKAGYKHQMRYQQNIRQNTTTSGNRKMNSRNDRIFNRNTVKISCSYMSNMKTIISSQNHRITNPKTITKERTCNYINKLKCPFSHNCLINNSFSKQYSNQPTLRRKNLLWHS